MAKKMKYGSSFYRKYLKESLLQYTAHICTLKCQPQLIPINKGNTWFKVYQYGPYLFLNTLKIYYLNISLTTTEYETHFFTQMVQSQFML